MVARWTIRRLSLRVGVDAAIGGLSAIGRLSTVGRLRTRYSRRIARAVDPVVDIVRDVVGAAQPDRETDTEPDCSCEAQRCATSEDVQGLDADALGSRSENAPGSRSKE